MGSEICPHKGKNGDFCPHKAEEGRKRRRREGKSRKGAENRGKGRGTKGENERKESKGETAVNPTLEALDILEFGGPGKKYRIFWDLGNRGGRGSVTLLAAEGGRKKSTLAKVYTGCYSSNTNVPRRPPPYPHASQ